MTNKNLDFDSANSASKKPHADRIVAFDAIETVAIAMACSMHFPLFANGSISAQIWMLACSCAVPAFFMVNGALLFNRPFVWKKHTARLRKIILCLFFWRLVYLVVFSLFGWFDITVFSVEDYGLYFLGANYTNLPTEHMWFMYALIAIYLIFPLFKRLFDQGNEKYVIYGCCIMFVFGVGITEMDLLFSAINAFIPSFSLNLASSVTSLYNPFGVWSMGFYFFMGPFVLKGIKKYQTIYPHIKLLFGNIALFLVGLFLNEIAQYIYTGAFRWTGITLTNQYLHVGTVFMGIAFFSFFYLLPWHNTTNARIMKFFSTNTLTIYFFHMMIMYSSTFYLFYPMGMQEAGLLIVIPRALFVILIGALVGSAMKKIPILKQLA